MIGVIMDRVDKYLGRGRHSIAVPVMDGPLHPNHKLDEAEETFALEGVDNLTAIGSEIWCSSGKSLMQLKGQARKPKEIAQYEASITCLAASEEGKLAIGLDGVGVIIRGGNHDGKRIDKLGGSDLRCPTAAVFLDKNTLVVTVGAKDRLHADWKRDLMAKGQSGEVWRIDLSSGNEKRLASGLAYPYGICSTAQGLAVSEAWAHRIVIVGDRGKPREVLGDLPGYPARIIPVTHGGYALAIYAPRNQLVEFVLREPEFLYAMVNQVHPDNWIAPKLKWGQGFKEPMQGAALKTMGIIKPWAPTWSYGLVAMLDENFQPVASFHSRADGNRHGVTSICERDGRLIVGAKGPGVAVSLGPAKTAEVH